MVNLFDGRLQKESKETLSAFELIQQILYTMKMMELQDTKIVMTVGKEYFVVSSVSFNSVSHGKDSDSTYVLSLTGEKMNIYDL